MSVYIKKHLKNKSVLITGGTGSFGKNLVRILLENFNLKKIVIFSRDEFKQFEMEKEFNKHKKILRFFIGDVRDLERLELATKNIDFVFHAAAMKHVPIAEYNPMEAIKTNILGSQNLIFACIKNKVKNVMALSTDKAVNPVNLYGSTKLAADKLFIAANNLSGKNGTKFSVVRYGNVLGSRGSVIPLFKKLSENKFNNLPITHPEMSRFFIAIEEAISFVLEMFNEMKGGEIFVPKIPSVEITELANAIAPYNNQKITGIRPGEKISEVLISEEESMYTYETHDHYVILPIILDNTKFSKVIKKYKKVKINFKYTSANNKKFLNKNEIISKCKKFNLL